MHTFLRTPASTATRYTRMASKSPVSEVSRRILLLIAEVANGRQADFSEQTGINPSTLSRLLSGKQEPTDEHLWQIEAMTSARFEWLKTGTLPMKWPQGERPSRSQADEGDGERLAKYMDRKGISQKELSDRLSKSTTTVNQYFKSKTLSPLTKRNLVAALGVSYDEIFGVQPNQKMDSRRLVPVHVDDSEPVYILRIPIRARAGFGYEAYFSGNSNEHEYQNIPSYKLFPGIKPELHVIVEVNGDSMQPQLEPGFEMLAYEMTKGKFPPLDKIVLVDFREELTIKRLVAIDWVDKNITLRSDNGGAEMRIAMDEIRTLWRVYDYHKARL